MTRRVFATLVLLYLVLYIAPLNQRPLISPDEARYAEVPREMIARSDWLVPRLNGMDYFEKPSLGYIAIAASISVLGPSPFAIRLSSALAAGLAALALGFFVQRRFKRRVLTGLALSIFLSMGEVYAVGTFAVLDMPFTAALSWSIVFALEARAERRFWPRQLWLVAFGVSAGLAFMIKGFLAIALPILVIAPLDLWEGRWRELLRDCWLPLLVCALTLLPWALTIHSRAPDFWNQFFWVEHVQRFSAKDAQHARPCFYYLPIVLAGALPWTALAPIAVRARIQSETEFSSFRKELRSLALWTLLPFLFFSASRGKLGTYILPCFVPLAGLLAFALLQIKDGASLRILRWLSLSLAGLFALAPIVLLVLVSFAPAKLAVYQWSEWPSILMISFAALLGAGGLFVASRRVRRIEEALELGDSVLAPILSLFALSALPLYLCFNFCLPARIARERSATEFLQSVALEIPADAAVITDKRLVHALCWRLQRDDLDILTYPGELGYGVSRPGQESRLALPAELLRRILDPNRRRAIALVVNQSYFQEASQIVRFPPASRVIENAPFHLLAIYDPPQPGPREPGQDQR